MRILVVEDDEKVAEALKKGLETARYEVTVSYTGEEGFYLVNAEKFDLVLLDLMLPGRDGLEILSTLRKKDAQTRVMILTARDEVDDRVLGLDCGADDYLVKPFAFSELLARIRALLRRGHIEAIVRLQAGDLEMDLPSREVTRDGRALRLTRREFDLLEYLMRNKGQVVSREMLARDVWKERARATPLDNVIDVHIAHLRRKIDEGFSRKMIKTVRGIGFIMSEEEES